MIEFRTLSMAALLSLSTGGALFGQAAKDPKPKIPEAQARATALAQVPGGKVRSEEYEHEDGHYIYSYDIKVAGRPGIEEINVDAFTGKVLAHEHEGPAAEKAEARKEKAEKADRGEKHETAEARESNEGGR